MNPDCSIETVLSAFDDYRTFVIFGHENPDADCLSSQRVLASWLSRQGKKTHICSAGRWKRVEIASWRPLFLDTIPNVDGKVLNVIVDCSSFERTGFLSKSLPAGPFMIIDHHAVGNEFGDVRYVDASSPSTTLIVQRIVEAAGDRLTAEEAELLFLGFCTDTGFFRHLDEGCGDCLRAAARLVDAGASPARTHRNLSGGHSLNSRRLLGRILGYSEIYLGGRLLVSRENVRDQQELGLSRDSDMLYQLLLGVSGVEAVAIVREQDNGTCVVGLRSVDELHVGKIAEFFGGGGHMHASGCLINGDADNVTDKLVQIFTDFIDGRL